MWCTYTFINTRYCIVLVWLEDSYWFHPKLIYLFIIFIAIKCAWADNRQWRGTINCLKEIIYVGLIIQMVNYICFCMALKLLCEYTEKKQALIYNDNESWNLPHQEKYIRIEFVKWFSFWFSATNWILSKLTIETSKVAKK